MLADMFTKALPKWKVVAHAHNLRVRRTCGGVVEVSTDER